MKRRQGLLLASTLLFMGACSGDSEAQPDPAPAEETVHEAAEPAEEEIAEKETAETAEETADAEVAEETPLQPEYRLNKANWSLEPLEDAPAKAVLLTIDDAPDKYALQMAETLHKLDVPAIFFVNGHFIESEEGKKTLEKIADLGFSIGNHTQSHANLKKLTEEEQRQEIMELNEAISLTTGRKPLFFRAPNGLNTDYSRNLVYQEGMVLMNWTYGYDWHKEYSTADALTDITVNTELLHNGANILLHDRKWTSEALPGIVKGLREKGYTFIDPLKIEGVVPD